MVESDELFKEREEEERIQEENKRENEKIIRNTTYYKRIKVYLLENFDKDERVPFNEECMDTILDKVSKEYSIKEPIPISCGYKRKTELLNWLWRI